MSKKHSAGFWLGTAAARIAVLTVIAVLLLQLGGLAYHMGYQVFAQKAVSSPPGKSVSVTIANGMSALEIGEMLEARGLIREAQVFRVQMSLYKYKDDIKAGTYILNTAQTADEMLDVLAGQAETESEE